MKFLRLALNNFTCYRGNIEVDFSDLEIFSITGPNGAGKSSLIDAIIFALYGKIPRVTTDVSSAISLGCKSMSVLLEFKTSDQKYKIARKIFLARSSGNQAIIEIEKENEWKSIASGIRKVNKSIEDIVGLDYEAFTRCIILPQGTFERFLTENKNRQDILIKLLNLQILGEMQKKAYKRYNDINNGIENINDRLIQNFDGISQESFKSLKTKIEFIENNLAQTQKILKKLELEYDYMEELLDTSKKLKDCEEELKQLEEKNKEVSKIQKKIEISKRISPYLLHLEQYKKIIERIKGLKLKEKELIRNEQELYKTSKDFENKFNKCEKDFKNLPLLEEELNKYEELLRLDFQLKNYQKEVVSQREWGNQEFLRLKDNEKGLKEKETKLKDIRDFIKDIEKNLKEMEIKKEQLKKFADNSSFLELLNETKKDYLKKQQKYLDLFNKLGEKKSENSNLNQKFTEQNKVVSSIKDKLKKYQEISFLEDKLFKLKEADMLQKSICEYLKELELEEELSRTYTERQNNLNKNIDLENESLKKLKSEFEHDKSFIKKQQEGYNLFHENYNSYNKLLPQISVCKEENEKLEKEKSDTEKTIEKLSKNIEEKNKEKELLEKEVESLDKEWLELHTKNLARNLREHVVVGDNCPVCSQIIKEMPEEDIKDFDEKGTEKKLKKRQKALTQLEKKLSSFETEMHVFVKEQKEIEKSIKTNHDYLKNLISEQKKYEEQMKTLVSSENYDEELNNLEKKIDSLETKIEKLDELIGDKSNNIKNFQFELNSIINTNKECKNKIERYKKQIEELNNKKNNLVEGNTDILSLKESIEKELENIKKLSELLKTEEKRLNDINFKKNIVEQQYKELNFTVDESNKEYMDSYNNFKQKKQEIKLSLKLEGDDIEEVLKNKVKEYENIEKEYRENQTEKIRLEKREQEETILCAKISSTINELQKNIEMKKDKIKILDEKIEELRNIIEEGSNGKDLEHLIKYTKDRKRIIEDSFYKAKELLSNVLREYEDCKEEKEELAITLKELQEEFLDLKNRVDNLLTELNLKDFVDLESYIVSPDNIAEWEKDVEFFIIKTKDIKDKIKLYQSRIGNKTISEEEFKKLEEQIDSKKKDYEDNIQEKGITIQKLEETKNKLLQKNSLEKELEKLQKRMPVLKQLSTDLKSNNFQSYVIENVLKTLAEDGSLHFEVLSGGRYAFILQKRDFYVVDRWNNNEIRPAKTLSGGETFIASLSLSLALSERIYQIGFQMGGSSAIESFFLDEGFGSLDDEHLDIVIMALNKLQGIGRTIGIISHVNMLNDYLPVKLVIYKTKEGSSISKTSNSEFPMKQQDRKIRH